MVGVYVVIHRGGIISWAAADLAIPIPGSETHAWAPIDDQAYLRAILTSSASVKGKA
jgi:hypothetical protein